MCICLGCALGSAWGYSAAARGSFPGCLKKTCPANAVVRLLVGSWRSKLREVDAQSMRESESRVRAREGGARDYFYITTTTASTEMRGRCAPPHLCVWWFSG